MKCTTKVMKPSIHKLEALKKDECCGLFWNLAHAPIYAAKEINAVRLISQSSLLTQRA